jgi:hypothetical protein
MHPGALFEAQASIPNTILDVMTVARMLQERYLWVDSLCLLQDDSERITGMYSNMDLFYELAVFTIVATSGADAHFGLPGVEPRPRQVSRFVEEVLPGLK